MFEILWVSGKMHYKYTISIAQFVFPTCKKHITPELEENFKIHLEYRKIGIYKLITLELAMY